MIRLIILSNAMKEWLQQCRHIAQQKPDRGSFTTESVIVTAILVGIAIAVGAVLLAKVLAKAKSINLG
ncbi:hypothetical protein ACGFIV_31265 [Sphaerisporangium sp. NPDC049003]|uniref:hypothetical protein n=1 Tax=Sphaerisporangium sp. NPDC049003 TaxID=3364517 RepID=UPI0037193EE4